jgi:translation initiation factor IF-2
MAENNKDGGKKKKIIKLKVKGKPVVKDTTQDLKEKRTETAKPEAPKRDKPSFKTNRTVSKDRPFTDNKKRPLSSTSINRKKTTTSTESSAPADKPHATRNKKTTHGKSRVVYSKEDAKKRQEEILLSKVQTKIKNRSKKGEAVIPEEIEIGEAITVSELAKKMNIKSSSLIQKLMELGVMANINDTIDADTAQILCSEFNCKVNVKNIKEEAEIKEEEDNPKNIKTRPPIVTVMGHVDHGKTKLLDAIRNSDVADHESGGITQHIGAYKVKIPKGEITFIDTPGHEAFTAMRARGAEVTDIVILVVAATEGAMPQTIEAINHAQAAKVPIIVAINKMDLPEANPDRIKQQLSEHGLMPEEWGGDTMYLAISALKKQGIDELLEGVLLQAELMELKADYKKRGVGYVIESKMDIGKGALATVVVRNGQMKVGDHFVVGAAMGKIRAMFDDKGRSLKAAMPSDPAEIMGFNELPNAGEKIYIVESDEFAREISTKRKNLNKLEENKNIKKIQMQNAMDKLASPNLKELKVIVKADVNGSVEAIKQSLSKLRNPEVKVQLIHSGVGAITESDVMLGSAASNTQDDSAVAIFAFRVRVDSVAKERAESEGIAIKRFNIIYELIDYITSILDGMIAPEVSENIIGTAEIKEVFKITGVGKIAGCQVTEGFIRKAENVRIYREGSQIWEGKLKALKRFQDDVSEVQSGFDCGMFFQNYENFKVGDIVECFHAEVKARKFIASDNSREKQEKSED